MSISIGRPPLTARRVAAHPAWREFAASGVLLSAVLVAMFLVLPRADRDTSALASRVPVSPEQLPAAELGARAVASIPGPGLIPAEEIAAGTEALVAQMEAVAAYEREQAQREAEAAALAAQRPQLPWTSAPFRGPLPVTRLIMPRAGINHYIEPTGIYANEMQAPNDGVSAVGWYYDLPTPGRPGNAMFSAHETWNRARGPFYALRSARPGDEIVLQMANGEQYRYAVMTNNRYSVDNIPMNEILFPSQRPANEEWITLLTCGGRFVATGGGYGEYLDRDVVVARRIG